jgi:hypothetical protein
MRDPLIVGKARLILGACLPYSPEARRAAQMIVSGGAARNRTETIARSGALSNWTLDLAFDGEQDIDALDRLGPRSAIIKFKLRASSEQKPSREAVLKRTHCEFQNCEHKRAFFGGGGCCAIIVAGIYNWLVCTIFARHTSSTIFSSMYN